MLNPLAPSYLQLGELVPRLLSRDLSFACLPHIFYYISNKRQDLLDLVLQDQGRVATGSGSAVVGSPAGGGGLAIHEGMFKGGPPTAATGKARFRRKRAGVKAKVTGGRGKVTGGGAGAGGWSRRAYLINYWLGLPQIRTAWKWTAGQQSALASALIKVLYRGSISLKDVKNLVIR